MAISPHHRLIQLPKVAKRFALESQFRVGCGLALHLQNAQGAVI
jgi:hypothetical protein